MKTGIWDYGHTDNLDRRVEEHNSGRTKSTKGRAWKLIFKRPFLSRLEANRFELEFKKLRNKIYVQREYKGYFIGV